MDGPLPRRKDKTLAVDHDMKMLTVETVRFKRTERSPWERGLIINYGDGPIIDMHGKVVPDEDGVWDWKELSETKITVVDVDDLNVTRIKPAASKTN